MVWHVRRSCTHSFSFSFQIYVNLKSRRNNSRCCSCKIIASLYKQHHIVLLSDIIMKSRLKYTCVITSTRSFILLGNCQRWKYDVQPVSLFKSSILNVLSESRNDINSVIPPKSAYTFQGKLWLPL